MRSLHVGRDDMRKSLEEFLLEFYLVVSDIIRIFATERRGVGSVLLSSLGDIKT